MENVLLTDWGWDSGWGEALAQCAQSGLAAGRVIDERRDALKVATERGELVAKLAGRLRHKSGAEADLPTVGDWVGLEPRWAEKTATVKLVLPRRTKLSRKAAGEQTLEQVLAANVDTVLIVSALNLELNARRLERYMAMARGGKVEPVLVLNKADLVDAPGEATAIVDGLGAPVLTLSAKSGQGMQALKPYLAARKTVALLGSSGVGKSTIINRLLGQDLLAAGDIRAGDDRGKHTTTSRQLFRLPSGVLVIDTPGIRELEVWDEGGGIEEAFEDIAELALRCKFTDCRHDTEPSCAVRAAIEAGSLDRGRWQNYLKLESEKASQLRRRDKKR